MFKPNVKLIKDNDKLVKLIINFKEYIEFFGNINKFFVKKLLALEVNS